MSEESERLDPTWETDEYVIWCFESKSADSERVDSSFEIAGEEDDKSSNSSIEEDASPVYASNTSKVNKAEWGDEGFLRVFPFTRVENYNVGPAFTPLDYFNLYFDTKFLSILAASINEQAKRSLSQCTKPNSRTHGWYDTNIEEITVFIALVLHMGHIKLQRINDYWRSDILFNLTFKNFITRDRFLLLLSHLAFLEPDSFDSSDESKFVNPIITFFNSQTKNLIYPSKNLIITESQVGCDNRDVIGHFNKGKTSKHGVQMFEVTDANGITVRMHAHKETGDLDNNDDIIMKIIEDYLNVGHSLYVGRVFTSVALAEKLLDKRTYLTGRLKPQIYRHLFPRTVVNEEAFVTRYNPRGLCITTKYKKKSIIMVTSEHHSKTAQCNNGQIALKSNVIVEYNKNMGSVQRKNQMLAYCSSIKRSPTWYRKLIIHIMDLMVLNAFIMYTEQMKTHYNNKSAKSLLDFRIHVVEMLLKLDGVTIKPAPRISSLATDKLTDCRIETNKGEVHLLEELPRNEKGKRKRRNCKHCLATRHLRKAAKYFCPVCDSEPGLCITCFRDYHKKILDKNCKIKDKEKEKEKEKGKESKEEKRITKVNLLRKQFY